MTELIETSEVGGHSTMTIEQTISHIALILLRQEWQQYRETDDIVAKANHIRKLYNLLHHYSEFLALDDNNWHTVLNELHQRYDAILLIQNALADETTPEIIHSSLQSLLEKHQRTLEELLASKTYRRWTKKMKKLFGQEINDIPEKLTTPHQFRHVYPVVLTRQLANVRAFDTAIESASKKTLETLRIELIALGDLITTVQDMLGTSASGFLDKLEATTTPLDTLRVSRLVLKPLKKVDGTDELIEQIREQQSMIREQFPAIWASFNTRTNQRKLSDAMLVLR